MPDARTLATAALIARVEMSRIALKKEAKSYITSGKSLEKTSRLAFKFQVFKTVRTRKKNTIIMQFWLCQVGSF